MRWPGKVCVTASSAPLRPETLRIRRFRAGDEAVLREVFFTSVHGLACRDYSADELAAWAPHEYDEAAWAARLQANLPFIAEVDGVAAGFADLQDSGFIDLFFVAGGFAGRGVGQALMTSLMDQAAQRGIAQIWANVSLRAERFFTCHGFVVEVRQVNQRHGVALRNARMVRRLIP